jgi:hypothetical protein
MNVPAVLSWGEAKQDSSNVRTVWFQRHNHKSSLMTSNDIFQKIFIVICSLEIISQP